jgi:Putative peptidoglycan binding domain
MFNVTPLKLSIIKKGSKGALVNSWQSFLNEGEFPVGLIDGDFGDRTEQATRSYQQKKGLPVTGVVDLPTYAKALNQGFLFKVPNFNSEMLFKFLRFSADEIRDLQRSINAVGQLNPPLLIDGDFGPRSNKGLAQVYKQRDVRLRAELEQQISTETKNKLGKDFAPALDIINSYGKKLRFRLSGPHWIDQYQTSKSLNDLASPFRERVQAFHKALIEAGSQVIIAATYRPKERAYMMHYAAKIDRGQIDVEDVPNMPGVDIDWVHYTKAGSIQAAEKMVEAYGIGGNPVALQSLHTERLAIDWNITWEGILKIKDARGQIIEIGAPFNGALNENLYRVGASYGVFKLPSDPPHWSVNGR